ncbi:MAG: ABC transporter permease subunit [Clostridia bacterium]|nr:ABC transporter permease subunit [Clostridia bacterium]
MKKYEKIIIPLLWIGVWTLISQRVSGFYLPSPYETGNTLIALFITKETYVIIGLSLLRVLIGLFFAIVLGVSTGIMAGVFNGFYRFLQPVLVAIKSTPVVSFIVLALIYMKSSYVPSFCGALLCYPVIYYNVIEGYRTVDTQLINMSKVYHVPMKRQLMKLYLPSMAPYIFAGVLTSIGIAWKGTIAAEVISVLNHSIGYEIYNGKIYLDTAAVFAWTIIIIACSLTIEKSTKHIIAKNKYYERFKVI